MTVDEIFGAFAREVLRAEEKFPCWPVDAVHGTAIMAEEAGEAVKAALDWHYGRGHIDQLRKELIQTAAMVVRGLLAIDLYGREGNDDQDQVRA